jgi:chromosome segregation ATPase
MKGEKTNTVKKGDRIMNINFDELGKKLHAKLDSSIDQLKAAKAHIEDVEKETKDTIQTKLNAAKETLEAKKQEASAAKARLEELVEAKKTETKEAVAEWKANHDRKKLEKRAERAEKNADVCVELALYYAAEAQVAILDAVAARRDADAAL